MTTADSHARPLLAKLVLEAMERNRDELSEIRDGAAKILLTLVDAVSRNHDAWCRGAVLRDRRGNPVSDRHQAVSG